MCPILILFQLIFVGRGYPQNILTQTFYYIVHFKCVATTIHYTNIRICIGNTAISYIHTYIHLRIYIHSHMCYLVLCFCPAFPPDVIEVTDICTNDFTVLWNSTEGLTYIVIILPPSMMNGTSVGPTMDTTHTFTDLMPNTVYTVSVNSMMDTCTGIPNTVMVTTLSEEVGLPQSELRT